MAQSGESGGPWDWGDLVITGVLGAWTVIHAQVTFEPSVAALLGALGVLLAPGYAASVALFPRNSATGGTIKIATPAEWSGQYTTVLSRFGLSLGLSICFAPLLGMGLHFSPSGVQSGLFLTTIGGLMLLLTVAAVVRRRAVHPDRRWTPQLLTVASEIGRSVSTRSRSPLTFSENTSTQQQALTGALLIGLILAASGIGFAVVTTDSGEEYTELYLLTENSDTGELVADDYPDTVRRGTSGEVIVGIENHERTSVNYTVVVALQRLDESGVLVEEQRVGRRSVAVPSGGTARFPQRFQPKLDGDELRLTVLLYKGPAPEAGVNAESAYRSVHIWIDTTSDATANT